MNEIQPSFREGAAVLRRSEGGLLELTDADRADFLQRMTTNNIAALRAGPGCCHGAHQPHGQDRPCLHGALPRR